jgi:hypothetical protein
MNNDATTRASAAPFDGDNTSFLDELTRRIAAKSSPKTKAGTGVEPSPSSTPATEAEATQEGEAAHGPDGECALPSSLMPAIEAEATREPNGRTRTDEELAHQIAGKSSQLTKAYEKRCPASDRPRTSSRDCTSRPRGADQGLACQ